MAKKLVPVVLFLILTLNPNLIFAASLPAPTAPLVVQATQTFQVSFNLTVDPATYHVKVRLGQSGTLNKAQTYEPASSKWLGDTDAWDSFPTFDAPSGTLQGALTTKTVSSVSVGDNLIEVSIRKIGSSTTQQSQTTTISVTAAPAEPTSNPEPNTPSSNLNISLSEFMPNPSKGDEWVEIFNLDSLEADLSGWKIDDGAGGSSPTTISKDSVIDPKGYKVFYFSSKLNNSGDTLRLLRSDGSEFEIVNFGTTTKDVSFAKDGSGKWIQTLTPTPGNKNVINTGEVLSSRDQSSSTSEDKPSTSDNYSLQVLTDLVATASSHSERPVNSPQKPLLKTQAKTFLPVILVGLGILMLLAALTIVGIKTGLIKKFRKKSPSGSL